MEQNTLLEKFMQAFGVLHRYQHKNAMESGHSGHIHRGQGRMLAMLKMKPGITRNELSYLMDMRPQSVGELLAKLEHQGFLLRTPSSEDRRAVDITLTEKGEEAAAQTEQQRQEFVNVLNFLSDDEQAQLDHILTRIITELQPSLEDSEIPGFGYGFRPVHDRHHAHDARHHHGPHHAHGPHHGPDHPHSCRGNCGDHEHHTAPPDAPSKP